MSWSIKLTAWTYLLGDATEWACQYYDPGRGAFIDGGWAGMDGEINFPAVTPNPGYLVVLLYNGSYMTPWIYSSTFLPSDGDKWQFSLYYHGESGDLMLLTGWTKLAEQSVAVKMAAAAPTGWTKLAEQSVAVKMAAAVPGGWVKLDEHTSNVKAGAPIPGGWVKLAEQSASVKMGVAHPGGWVQLGNSVNGSIKNGFAIPPNFKLVQQNVYPDGKSYSGPAQRCVSTWSFLPSNFPGASWFTQHLFINHLASKISEQGEKPLTMKLYENGTHYFLVIEATNTATGYVRQFPWLIVIAAALVLAIIIAIVVTIIHTEDFFYKAPAAAAAFTVLVLGVAAAAVVGVAIWKGVITGKKKTPARVPVRT